MLKREVSQRLGYAQQAPPPVGQQQHKQQVAAGSMGRQTKPSEEGNGEPPGAPFVRLPEAAKLSILWYLLINQQL